MADLTLLAPQSAYPSILTTTSPNGLSNVLQVITDGLNHPSPLSLSTNAININTQMGGAGAGFFIDGIKIDLIPANLNSVLRGDFSYLFTALRIPNGTTEQRPDPASNGDFRYNTTTDRIEAVENGSWIEITSAGGGYGPGDPTFISDTYGADTFNVFLGTPEPDFTNRVECTLFGDKVLQAVSSGSRLSAFGYQSLTANTTGFNNSAFGHLSGSSLTIGFNNSLFGKSCGQNLVSGDNNCIFGFESGLGLTGNSNSVFGVGAGRSNSNGDNNCFFGFESSRNSDVVSNCSSYGFNSLRNNESNLCCAFGSLAAYNNISGTLINAFGYSALYSNSFGNENSAFADEALFNNQDGDYNCAFGSQSAYSSLSANSVSAYGHHSLKANLTSSNSAFGKDSALSNTTGTVDAFGFESLKTNTTGTSNCSFGRASLRANTVAGSLSAFGYQAATAFNGGAANNIISAFGYQAAYNTNPAPATDLYYVDVFGVQAAFLNTTGNYNTGFGAYTIYCNQTGDNNSAFGSWACGGNNGTPSSCSDNSAFGAFSLGSVTTGSSNTSIGALCFQDISTGSNNVGVGYNVSSNRNTISKCTLIGNAVNTSSDGLTYATAIGADAVVGASHSLVLGRLDNTNPTKVGIGTIAPASPLHIVGDFRQKGIVTDFTGTDLLTRQHGFIVVSSATSTLDFPLQVNSANAVFVKIRILVMNSGTLFAFAESTACASSNTVSATAIGSLPTITYTASSGSFTPTSAWSVSGNNLRLSLTGDADDVNIFVVTSELFAVNGS